MNEAATPASKLVIDGVSKWFRTDRANVHALDGIDLRVGEGEVVCLVGPSGCGKSTLLDIMAGLTNPDRGRVLADNQLVEGPGRHRLVMFQESALFPWLNVLGNVLFGLRRKPGLTDRERREIAEHHLELAADHSRAEALPSVCWVPLALLIRRAGEHPERQSNDDADGVAHQQPSQRHAGRLQQCAVAQRFP